MVVAFNATLADFSAGQVQALLLLNDICSGLSLAGSLSIIFLYIYFKHLRSLPVRLIFILSLADIGVCVANLMGDPNDSPLCLVQGVLLSFFRLASVLWTFVIALVMYLMVVMRITADRLEKREVIFHLCVWGGAFAISLLPFSTNSYGESGAWCWIKSDVAGNWWRFAQFFLFLWLVFIVNSVLYILTIRSVRSSVAVFGHASNAALRRLGVYPLLLVLAYSFATVNRLQNWIAPHQPQFWLFVLHVVFAGLNGLMNAVAYSTAPAVRAALRLELARLPCARCCPRPGPRPAAAGIVLSPIASDRAGSSVLPLGVSGLDADERAVLAAGIEHVAVAAPAEPGQWRRRPDSAAGAAKRSAPQTQALLGPGALGEAGEREGGRGSDPA